MILESLIYCKSSVEPSGLGVFFVARFLPTISLVGTGMFRIPRNIVSRVCLEMYTFHVNPWVIVTKWVIFAYLVINKASVVMSLFLFYSVLFVLSDFFPSLILVQVYKNSLMNALILFCYKLISTSMIYSFMFIISFYLGI